MALAATRDYQRRLLALRGVTYAGIRQAWRRLDQQRLDDTWPDFLTAVLTVVLAGRSLSDALAAAYLRSAAPAAVLAGPTSPLDAEAFAGALRSASVVSVKAATAAGRDPALASRNALVNSMGVADKAVRDAGRDRVRSASRNGWTRVTSGAACDFCESLTGEVLPATAEMASHPNCGCVPEPVAA